MKAGTLVCATVILGLLLLQEVNGGNRVKDKKLDRWSKKDLNVEVKMKKFKLKNYPGKLKKEDKVEDLIEVIQYVITNTFNNQEFRTFMIKRFLHNYVSEVTDYLEEIKELKIEMDPKAATKVDKINKAIYVQK